MKASRGFTVVEGLVTFVFLAFIASIFYSQYQSNESIHRDHNRKVSINAIYYNLEEVVKPALSGKYPRVLSASQLTAMDEALLKDPQGIMIGNKNSDYRYEPTGCHGGDTCTGFTLRSDLEREQDFIKSSFKR